MDRFVTQSRRLIIQMALRLRAIWIVSLIFLFQAAGTNQTGFDISVFGQMPSKIGAGLRACGPPSLYKFTASDLKEAYESQRQRLHCSAMPLAGNLCFLVGSLSFCAVFFHGDNPRDKGIHFTRSPAKPSYSCVAALCIGAAAPSMPTPAQTNEQILKSNMVWSFHFIMEVFSKKSIHSIPTGSVKGES